MKAQVLVDFFNKHVEITFNNCWLNRIGSCRDAGPGNRRRGKKRQFTGRQEQLIRTATRRGLLSWFRCKMCRLMPLELAGKRLVPLISRSNVSISLKKYFIGTINISARVRLFGHNARFTAVLESYKWRTMREAKTHSNYPGCIHHVHYQVNQQ